MRTISKRKCVPFDAISVTMPNQPSCSAAMGSTASASPLPRQTFTFSAAGAHTRKRTRPPSSTSVPNGMACERLILMAIASPVDEDRATRITEAQPRSCDAYRAQTQTTKKDKKNKKHHKHSSGGPEASIHLKVECILHSSVYRDALRACAPLSQRRAAVVRSRCEYRSSDGRSVNSRNYNKSNFYTRIGSHSSARVWCVGTW